MARKSNKTAHVLNLLAGHDAAKETDEQASIEQAASGSAPARTASDGAALQKAQTVSGTAPQAAQAASGGAVPQSAQTASGSTASQTAQMVSGGAGSQPQAAQPLRQTAGQAVSPGIAGQPAVPSPIPAQPQASAAPPQNNIAMIDKTGDDPVAELIQQKLSSEFEKQMQQSRPNSLAQAEPTPTPEAAPAAGLKGSADTVSAADTEAGSFEGTNPETLPLSESEDFDPDILLPTDSEDFDPDILLPTESEDFEPDILLPSDSEDFEPETDFHSAPAASPVPEVNIASGSGTSAVTEVNTADTAAVGNDTAAITDSAPAEELIPQQAVEAASAPAAAPIPEAAPAAQAASVQNSAPAAQIPPAQNSAPAAQATPIQNTAPAAQAAPAQNSTPTSQSAPVQSNAAMPETSPVQEAAAPRQPVPEPEPEEPEPNFAAVNVMEHIVRDKIIYYMRQFDVCTCDRCKADVIALTLNGLMPKYIVTMKEAVDPLLSYYTNRLISDVTVEATKSCMIVKENPRH